MKIHEILESLRRIEALENTSGSKLPTAPRAASIDDSVDDDGDERDEDDEWIEPEDRNEHPDVLEFKKYANEVAPGLWALSDYIDPIYNRDRVSKLTSVIEKMLKVDPYMDSEDRKHPRPNDSNMIFYFWNDDANGAGQIWIDVEDEHLYQYSGGERPSKNNRNSLLDKLSPLAEKYAESGSRRWDTKDEQPAREMLKILKHSRDALHRVENPDWEPPKYVRGNPPMKKPKPLDPHKDTKARELRK